MRTNEILPLIYDNFDAFHTMTLSTSLMSTYNCKEFDSDAHKIINFIGRAFRLEQSLIDEFETCILGDMMNIGLIADYQAISSTELLSDNDRENIELYEIKGRILEQVAVNEAQSYNVSDIRILTHIRANMKYDHFHHPYNAKLRFWQLGRLVRNGNTDIIRQIAILYALGIGCEENYQKSRDNFLKCLLWGDKISAVLINNLLEETGRKNSEYHKIHFESVPNFEYDDKAWEYWQLMKLLNIYIISPKKDFLINNELAEVLISDEISQCDKIELISNFNENTWRNIHTLTSVKKNPIGFKAG